MIGIFRRVLLFAVFAATACQRYADSTPRAIVIDYAWRPGVVTTDDWAFELVAPRSWIDEQLRELDLDAADGEWGFEDLRRPDRGGLPDWYAPLPIDSYQRYVLLATSIPYVHMLVSKTPEPDARYRVFTRKR